jgi:hypothetical protein
LGIIIVSHDKRLISHVNRFPRHGKGNLDIFITSLDS